jgi:hypothetical protein
MDLGRKKRARKSGFAFIGKEAPLVTPESLLDSPVVDELFLLLLLFQ